MRDPHPKPEWVLRRYTFIGDLGGLDIDISAAQGMDLSTWLKWVGEITAPFPVTGPNAKVAGYPAVAFAEKGVGVHDGALSVFVSDGQYVYRFWYTAIYSEDGLRAYQHILDTFRLPGAHRRRRRNSTAGDTESPASIGVREHSDAKLSECL